MQMTMKRTFVTAALLACAVLSAPSAHADGGASARHPHFDDQGTLNWTTTLADAQKAAKRDNRLILVEYGREK